MAKGNHFFFLGRRGAGIAAEHTDHLLQEINAISGRIAEILCEVETHASLSPVREEA
jgi:hypothetical protein